MLVLKRTTPVTPIAKSASFFSENSFTCLGVMICSARCFRSSGRTGCIGREWRSPFTRTVGGRPTLRCRSDPARRTICEIACLKLNGAAVGAPSSPGRSAMGIHAEKDLAEFDRLRVLHAHFSYDAGEVRLDLVHDFHRLDDADRLPRGDPLPRLSCPLGPRLRRRAKGSGPRRLDLLERRDGGGAGRLGPIA